MSNIMKVIKEDISYKGKGASNCPVAMSFRRVLHLGERDVACGPYDVAIFNTLEDKHSWLRYELPEVAKKAIEGWDRGLGMEPFEFELPEPKIIKSQEIG